MIISRKARRNLKLFFFLFLCFALVVVCIRNFWRLPKVAYLTGWLLLLMMFVLALYNGRKKIPFLPLATSKGWLQFHVYAGYSTFLVFLFHLHFRLPSGGFELTLATLYMLVMISGILGLFISRSFPRRLTGLGGEVIYEKIPVVRRQLKERAETLALKSVSDVQATTTADFYVTHLADFFSRPKNFWRHLFESHASRNRLLKKIEDLNRFLNEKERIAMAEIANLVRQKDGLDYHHALQLTLKTWLFVHIPLTYSLLVFSVVHVVLVYAFSGGAG